MTPYSKPLPKLNGDNRPFWEGCKQHELRFQQCTACGLVRWPPAFLCPQCHSPQATWQVSSGLGKVHTFAVYHAAFHPAFTADLPYVVAVVALDDGPHLLTNLIECRPEEVKCDLRVQVTWEDVTEEITLPKFMPL
jgi:uncharacterized OB-fold protein